MITWYKTATDMTRSPKHLLLMQDLGDRAFFCVHALIGFVCEKRPTGYLAGLSIDEIEMAAQWRGEPGAFVAACVKRRVLDETPDGLYLHDHEGINPGIVEHAQKKANLSERGKKGANARWHKQAHATEMLTDAQASTSIPEAHAIELDTEVDQEEGGDRGRTHEAPPAPAASPAEKLPPAFPSLLPKSGPHPYTPEQLALLAAAVPKRMGRMRPESLPGKIKHEIGELVGFGEFKPDVLEDWNALDNDEVVAWCAEALRRASETDAPPVKWLRVAAREVGRALNSGVNLVEAAAPAEAKGAIVDFPTQNPHAGKVWAPLWDRRVVGVVKEVEKDHVAFVAGKLGHLLRDGGLERAVMSLYVREGLDASMTLAWEKWPKPKSAPEASNG